ncbi:S41 family peptidase [Chitinophaga barathri]|uniref:Tail specific protease domain-containing protein n=1 Tax=Chitinophaga barathri TaxID=1647451 RepID=A0A3N4MP78_9BACT|nr:S41 family peptidase [Chitinophaga barathri]RPD41479.1 hypothetical protein EG028_09175 [Chitinophaga barathri]
MKRKLFLTAFALGALAPAMAQTTQQAENLYTFTRLYGYVRYFHPSDANVVTDWETFAVYGAREAEKARNPQELRQTLAGLFNTVAPGLQIHPSDSTAPPVVKPAGADNMKAVVWQHNGYGAGSNSQTYKSIRTNSYSKVPPSQEQSAHFSTISGSIDATPYRGRTIRYTAAAKAESLGGGTGQLWLRVDRESGKPGFFDNMDDRAITGVNKDWRRDTIIGKINEDAKAVVFGCFVVNKGSLLLDDMKLEIETPEGWKTIPGLNGDFENDSLGAKPGYWQFNSGDPLFTVKTGNKAFTGKQALILERTMQEGNMRKAPALFTNDIPAGTTVTKNIGNGLSVTMPVALWSDGKQVYPFSDTAAAIAQNKMMERQLTIPFTGDDLYVRLAGVVITWNVIRHFHPYYQEWVTDWDKDLRLALQDCYRQTTAAGFDNTLRTLTAKLHDGHVFVVSPYGMRNRSMLPLKWEWVKNKLVITRVLSPDITLQPGDVITAINGTPAKEYVDKAVLLTSAGSANALMRASLSNMISGPKDSVLQLTVASADKGIRQVNVSYKMGAAEYYKPSDEKPAYRQIDNHTIYLNLTQMPWDSIKPKLAELAAAKTVIFDLRGYPKDMNGSMIIRHLLKKPENDKWMHMQQMSLPDHEKTGWMDIGWGLRPETPHIGGKVFFLINGSAISYAESVMGYIKDFKMATIIGEPTAGANGDINRVTLPGGYVFTFTGLKVTNHDGSQHFMKGVLPDVTVLKTINGIRNNEDEVLAKAVELSKQ